MKCLVLLWKDRLYGLARLMEQCALGTWPVSVSCVHTKRVYTILKRRVDVLAGKLSGDASAEEQELLAEEAAAAEKPSLMTAEEEAELAELMDL